MTKSLHTRSARPHKLSRSPQVCPNSPQLGPSLAKPNVIEHGPNLAEGSPRYGHAIWANESQTPLDAHVWSNSRQESLEPDPYFAECCPNVFELNPKLADLAPQSAEMSPHSVEYPKTHANFTPTVRWKSWVPSDQQVWPTFPSTREHQWVCNRRATVDKSTLRLVDELWTDSRLNRRRAAVGEESMACQRTVGESSMHGWQATDELPGKQTADERATPPPATAVKIRPSIERKAAATTSDGRCVATTAEQRGPDAQLSNICSSSSNAVNGASL